MATPTNGTPTSAKRPTTGAGSGTATTPSHLSQASPAPPRSVPSPATGRAHTAGKTPTSSTHANKTVPGSGGTPMMRNLSQTTSNASPSTAAAIAAAASAGAAGVGAGAGGHHSHGHLPATPSLVPGSAGGSGIGSAGPGPGSVPMGPSLSELGLSLSLSRSLSSCGGLNGGGAGGLGIAGLGSSAGTGGVGGGLGHAGSTGGAHSLGGVGAANEDSLRRARLRRVLGNLARPAGRVSEEGIARIARRVGFAIDLDDGGGIGATTAEAEARVGNRTVTVAGNTVMIELDLQSNIPRTVNVAVNGGGDAMRDEEKRAGEVLLRSFKVDDDSGGGVCGAGLGRFARDLEALARIDRLSSQRLSCFEALSGIYGCLRRLWEVEVKAAKEEIEKSGMGRGREASEEEIDERAEALVMTKKSGLALAHGRERIGWELVYWKSGCRALKRNRKQPDDGDMEVDGAEGKDNDTSATDCLNNDTTFSLQLETEASPAGLFPALRISEAWLPETIDLPPPDPGNGLPWQDPAPTFLAPDDNADAMAVDGGPDHHKIPDLRFVARLEPPLVMPYPVAVQILASVGLPAPNVMTLPPQYAAQAIDAAASANAQPGLFSQTARQTVLSIANGRESLETHVYTLGTAKPDWSYILHDIPFSHPRQLIDLLPTLRQWAQVGTLLRQALVTEAISAEEQPVEQSTPATISLSDLMASPGRADSQLTNDSSDKSSTCPISILLNTAPVPTFKFTFPISSTSHARSQQGRLGNVTMQVLANAELAVVSYDGLDLPSANIPGVNENNKKDGDDENGKQDSNANSDEKSSGQNDDATNAQEAVDKENGKLKQRHDVQKRLARALAVCGDCRVWIEWMRGMAARS